MIAPTCRPYDTYSLSLDRSAPRTGHLTFVLVALCCLAILLCHARLTHAVEPGGLIAHWPLNGDARDRSGHGRDLVEHAVQWSPTSANNQSRRVARLDGQAAYLELPAERSPRWKDGDFTVSLWAHVASDQSDAPGDLISHYASQMRRGWQLSIKSNQGVTFSEANSRQLQFALDDNRPVTWRDCGRPGDGLLAFALAEYNGSLYAGVCRPGANESGRVYRYAGGQQWIDCGAPDGSNTVTSLAVYQDQLFAGTGKYRVAGSALPESPNTTPGGRVFRYAIDANQWIDCGQLPECEAVSGLVVFRNRLYAASLYKPAGFFRYVSGQKWETLPVPDGKRVEALTVHNGSIYATTYDGGRVFRFDGMQWHDCGQVGAEGENTQTYAFATYQGSLHVGTWPSGRVYRLEADGRWSDLGRLGEELEVMGMLVHNGRLLAGTLPSAQVYDLEPSGKWTLLKQLDTTPDVKYRRAWTMCEHAGSLFCGTLPSGRVHALDVGHVVMSREPVAEGWQHIVAVRRGAELELIHGGKSTASRLAPADSYNLSPDVPLRVGFGQNAHFHGDIAEVRLYDRALTAAELAQLGTLAPR